MDAQLGYADECALCTFIQWLEKKSWKYAVISVIMVGLIDNGCCVGRVRRFKQNLMPEQKLKKYTMIDWEYLVYAVMMYQIQMK